MQLLHDVTIDLNVAIVKPAPMFKPPICHGPRAPQISAILRQTSSFRAYRSVNRFGFKRDALANGRNVAGKSGMGNSTNILSVGAHITTICTTSECRQWRISGAMQTK